MKKRKVIIEIGIGVIFLGIIFGVRFATIQCRQASSVVPSPSGGGEVVSSFSYQRIEPDLGLVVRGEAATIGTEGQTTVAAPDMRLETDEGKILLVQTAPNGSAELNFDSKTGRLQEMILKGGVTTICRDKKTGQTEFTTESECVTFHYDRQEIVLTGKPVVRQNENEFRGQIIRYLLKEGKIYIESGASGQIHY